MPSPSPNKKHKTRKSRILPQPEIGHISDHKRQKFEFPPGQTDHNKSDISGFSKDSTPKSGGGKLRLKKLRRKQRKNRR